MPILVKNECNFKTSVISNLDNCAYTFNTTRIEKVELTSLDGLILGRISWSGDSPWLLDGTSSLISHDQSPRNPHIFVLTVSPDYRKDLSKGPYQMR